MYIIFLIILKTNKKCSTLIFDSIDPQRLLDRIPKQKVNISIIMKLLLFRKKVDVKDFF